MVVNTDSPNSQHPSIFARQQRKKEGIVYPELSKRTSVVSNLMQYEGTPSSSMY
jgi:hypothetical protein